MHPALIPELHPMCGKYMEALVQCRKENRVARYWGACNQHTYDLSKCLVEEKRESRAPRQAKYQEEWRAKRKADEERMKKLDEELERRRAARAAEADATAATPGSS